MLSSIIKDGKKASDLEAELSREEIEESHTPKRDPPNKENSKGMERSRSGSRTRLDREKSVHSEKITDMIGNEKYCYVYYDTGLHWCRACDKFPETAKEFLQHLHSDQHQERAKENEVDTTPWHKLPVEPLLPSYDDAPKKRIPIKGLQFFISAPSWYCKLCDVWIGDLHCASHHLKSQAHFQNYENFVHQNPHWETEWLKDRDTAMSRNGKKQEKDSSDSDSDDKQKHHKRKRSHESSKDKKKKKRSKKKKKADSSDSSSSSSSSSESSSEDEETKGDKAKSIRVAMRNMQQVKSIMDEDMSKWSVLEKLMEDVRKKESKKEDNKQEDELINQWMSVANPVGEKEKNMLETLKDRMKAKHDVEKAKIAEQEKRRRDKELEEKEMYERKLRQAREETERAERELKRKEMEYNKVLDKDRGHVKFKPSRDNFRRHRSSSIEEDERASRQSRERDSRSRPRESRDRSPQFRPRRPTDNHRDRSPDVLNKDQDDAKRRPPGPPSYKKLPFIGRMPLFKNKKGQKPVEKVRKEVAKQDYEPTRKTRFESGNLTRAFIPRPDVVCFPVLTTLPPISAPPEPTAVEQVVSRTPQIDYVPKVTKPPEPPKLAAPSPPPPPPIEEEVYYGAEPAPPPPEGPEYYDVYQQENSYEDSLPPPPLEPPPLPPDDDLAMLGICADDMAAQTF
ncbi:zinc finger matrin-type protein CG9776-like isoform X2 [Anthonomus grandis grandis]|nr:zinc finger matrin-type protein CG9776-like isoform X2 [Anthonomus grandis grandis]